jgi:hypothetical protein
VQKGCELWDQQELQATRQKHLRLQSNFVKKAQKTSLVGKAKAFLHVLAGVVGKCLLPHDLLREMLWEVERLCVVCTSENFT